MAKVVKIKEKVKGLAFAATTIVFAVTPAGSAGEKLNVTVSLLGLPVTLMVELRYVAVPAVP